uniref:Guanylate-binding protein 4-like isoform X3 n=1 Tax=Rhizophora mucronata TaxID=61149 RepID=A0A2P2MHZ9_RHIMU
MKPFNMSLIMMVSFPPAVSVEDMIVILSVIATFFNKRLDGCLYFAGDKNIDLVIALFDLNSNLMNIV